jgi:protein-tyrosine phosphatase
MQNNKKISVLFVCLGNICRSPMAETVMKDIVSKHADEDNWFIDSAGILDYHEGEQADGRMRSAAFERGYRITSISRPVRKDDFHKFDYIVGMDSSNINRLNSLCPEDSKAIIVPMVKYCTRHDADSVPDPYYGGREGFFHVIDLLEDACQGLYDALK